MPCIRREDGRCRFCLKGIETHEHALLLYTGSNEPIESRLRSFLVLIPLFLALPLSLTHHRFTAGDAFRPDRNGTDFGNTT